MRISSRILAVLVGLVAVAPARATTLVQLSLERLSQASNCIVRGRVVGHESRWNASHTQVVTLTTIELDQIVKGSPPSSLVVEQPGGSVGNIHVRVVGTARLVPGASYFLFLEPAGDDASRYSLVGMAQGAYRVFRDSTTGEERVVRPFGGLFYGRGGKGRGWGAAQQTPSVREFRRELSVALEAPLNIPQGTSLPVAIMATEPLGSGRVRVIARTGATVYPSRTVVVPRGSLVEGTAQRVSGKWRIRWTELSIRGSRVGIDARSEEPAGETLRARQLMVTVR